MAPSIHMPRWACRILLGITDVRVARLLDIGQRNAMAESFTAFYSGPTHDVKNPTRCGVENPPLIETPPEAFRYVWESIGDAGSWDRNPRVWVIEFQRIK